MLFPCEFCVVKDEFSVHGGRGEKNYHHRVLLTGHCDIHTRVSGCSGAWTQCSECSVASLIWSSTDGILSFPTSSRAHDLLVDESIMLFNHLTY